MKYLITFVLAVVLSACGGGDDKQTEPALTPTSTPTLSAAVLTAFGADPTKTDTDNDGLTDEFEIKFGYPYLKPDSKDTNNNGVNDADEDSDNDGLTNLQEQQYKTLPLSEDSDGDGISDKDEIFTYKTDPNNPDTDGDGIPDGREVANGSDPLVKDADKVVTSSASQTIIDAATGTTNNVRVTITGQGDLGSQIVVKNFSDQKITGQVGKSYDIGLKSGSGSSVNADIILPYDKADPNAIDPSSLAIYTINPTTGAYEELPSTVDATNGTVKATTTHFTPFFVANKYTFGNFLKTIPQTCDLISDPNAKPADVFLVIDSSGSMGWNDPSDLRKQAAKNFVARMKATDRVGVVDFDSAARLAVGLSASQSSINSAIDTIDSNGGTDIGSGVSIALSQLTANSDSTKNRAIILLTDGDGSYDTTLTTQLASAGIRVFTIGLTGAVNTTLLQGIANGTSGGYKQIATADGLNSIFTDFASVFGDTGKDTDGDGLTDCQEIQGIFISNLGITVITDPNKPDTDGDGLADGSEISIPTKTSLSVTTTPWTAIAFSRPDVGYADTDSDGISDSDEFRFGTSPLSKDTDGDGLTDYEEIFTHQTDPVTDDSDGDGLSDRDEILRASEGLDPLIFDYKVNSSFRFEFVKGFFAGDIIEIDNTPKLIGQISSGLIPVVGTAFDVRDLFANLFKGEWASAALSGAGVVPLVGDAANSGSKAAKFLAKFPNKRFEIIKYIDKYIPDGIAKYLPSPPAKVGAWLENPFKRGKMLEETIGASIPGDKLLGNFPSIDVWDTSVGKATSIKTLDTSAKTYQNAAAFKRRLERYTAVLKGFPPSSGVRGTSATTGKKYDIYPQDVTSRELVIGVPNELISEFSKIAKEVESSSGIKIIFQITQ